MNLKKLVKSIFYVCFLLFSTAALAQTKVVTGKVTDSKDGSAVPNASVLATGGSGKAGTQTAADGTFKITVPSGTTKLVISSIGFEKMEVSVVGKTTVDVALKASASDVLTEVVVSGYATPSKREVTGAVTSVKAKDFNQGAILAPDQLLQNKVAGLEVTNTSGQPGVASTIQIRGNSSIRSSNNPLFVVDGVPLDGTSARPNLGNTFGSTPNSNPLLFIDPNSIAQVEVLKDASSAAIYGARGANGVIVITTKKGSAGVMKVDVGTNFGVNVGYMKKFGVLSPSQYRSALTKYGQPSSLDGGTNEDALKAITQNGFSQNYSVAFSGGSDIGKYRASFLGSHTNGFLKKSALDKYLGTFGGTYKFLDKRLTIDFNLITGNYGEQLTSVSNTAGSTGNIISSALSWNPTTALVGANGIYNYPTNGSGNPLAFNDAYNDKSTVNSYLANISAAYKITDKLEYKFLYGVNHGAGSRKMNIDGWLQGFPGLSGQGYAAIGDATLLSQTFTHTLNYLTPLTKTISLNAIAGYEYFKTDFSGGSINASGFNTNLDQSTRINIPYTSYMQNAKTQNPYTSFANPTAELQSYFARAIFSFDDKLVLNASLRSDGSSKFGKNNKYGYFPAVGAKWNVSNQSFMKNNKIFSNLSLRASYGLTGNQEFPAGASQEQFGLNSYNNAPQVVNGNPNLKWESSKSVNIGADFAFAKGRIYGSFDYYNKTTTDILFQTNAIQPAPSSITFVNLKNAQLINSGFELALGASVVDKKDLSWDVNFNVAYNKNNIKKFTDPNTGLDNFVQTGQINGQGVSGTLAQVITNNQPVNAYYLKPFQGFDASGNQIIGANPQFAGDPNPHVLAGFSTSLRYQKFTFSLNMGGAFGFLIYNNTATSVTNISGIAQGRNIDVAAYNSAEKPSSGVGASTRFLEKGDYFKLRNATIRYNLGNTGKYIKNLSAFVSGSNLFVITKFTGFDPEVNIDKSNNSYPSRSIEYVPYPTPRTISFGFNFSL
ncbi:SusC/RagA family TonB-linked outer membrane protein [Parasediminibacterium paludis]|uniref:SusC/RagA family TonB-linked outer membrane protein n=1 Tax=Parasediminibacterium paludis TaxID=908966 RepID=A0ABV8PUW3_9BACT